MFHFLVLVASVSLLILSWIPASLCDHAQWGSTIKKWKHCLTNMLREILNRRFQAWSKFFSVFQHQSRWLEQNKADSDVMGEYQLRNIPLLPAIRIELFMDRQGFTEYTQQYTHGFGASAHNHTHTCTLHLRQSKKQGSMNVTVEALLAATSLTWLLSVSVAVGSDWLIP